MCGIVGISSNKDCIQNIIFGLKALEYRGYDSSGIAINNNNSFAIDQIVLPHTGYVSKVLGDNFRHSTPLDSCLSWLTVITLPIT